MRSIQSVGLLLLVCVLIMPIITGCGPEPTPTSAPPTEEVAAPTTVAAPTDTPRPTATATPEPTSTPTPPPTPAAMYEEARCAFELPPGEVDGETVDCGYLTVPEDRNSPNGRSIQLAVAVFRHPDGNPEPDPVLYLEGGPGGSALEFIYLSFDNMSAAAFAANRDLIVFDQRGVGLSTPTLDCPEVDELTLELLDSEVDGRELSDEEVSDLILEAILACAIDLRQVATLAAYHTSANAADVADLRVALGYDQVNLWGVSYGTNLALAVMRDHPDGVRSVILDSAYPPDRDIYAEGPHNTDRAFDLLFDTCAGDEACAAAYPDLRDTFFDTVDRLNVTPARFETTNPLTGESYDVALDGDSLMVLLFEFLYYTEVIPSLPQILYQASEGSYGSAARLLGVALASEEAVSRGMHFSTQCHDELGFSSLKQFEAALDEVPELKGLFEDSVAGTLGYEICEGWQSGQADSAVTEPVTSDIPTLIMAGEYDPITPPDWGRHAAETLANAYFFEYPGVGHAASLVAGCPPDMMIAFLEDPASAPDDACIREMGPVQWVLPAGPIEMEPFTNATMGIQGLVPAGWDEISLGAYARQDSAMDVALVVAQAAPMSAESLLELLTGQLGLERDPNSVGERAANDIAWTLYAVEVQGVALDIAVAEAGELALLVMLQSDPGERDALYEAVFLPVVDGLTPLE